jgi:hypothetical protein
VRRTLASLRDTHGGAGDVTSMQSPHYRSVRLYGLCVVVIHLACSVASMSFLALMLN